MKIKATLLFIRNVLIMCFWSSNWWGLAKRTWIFPLLQDTLFDEYVVAHTIGWWCKAITIRNEPFLWVLSIAFEFAEVSIYRHWHAQGRSWYKMHNFAFGLCCIQFIYHQHLSSLYILLFLIAEKFYPYASKLQRVLVGQLCPRCVDLQLVWYVEIPPYLWDNVVMLYDLQV